MIIAGKSLQEWTDAPIGAFAKAVRGSVDPLWGKYTQGDLKAFRVVVHYLPEQVPEEETVMVEAVNEEEAAEMACDQVAAKAERITDLWAHKTTEIK